MPKQLAAIDYRRCEPEKCNSGICLAVAACPNCILKQDACCEMPDLNPMLCVGCGLCAQACPLKALRMM